MAMMKAAVFVEPGRIELQDKPIPEIGPNDALLRITTTTICGTDVHILKGEYPVAPGLTIGHEPVGIIEKLGSNVKGYQEGQRVIAGAICPSFTSYACQDGLPSQDGGCSCHGYKPMGGGAQTDRPLGEDHHDVADLDVGGIGAGEAGGHDVGAHQHLLVGQAVRHWCQVGLRIGYQHVLGLGTIDGVAEAPAAHGLVAVA